MTSKLKEKLDELTKTGINEEILRTGIPIKGINLKSKLQDNIEERLNKTQNRYEK